MLEVILMKRNKLIAFVLSAAIVAGSFSVVPREFVFADENDETIEEPIEEVSPDDPDDATGDDGVTTEEELIDDDLLSTNGYSRADAVSWALNKVGEAYDTFWGYFNGHNLIRDYSTALGNSDEYGPLETNDYVNGDPPYNWRKVYCNYQPGDIAVWKNNLSVINGFSNIETDDRFGHTGIIVSCDEYGFYAVELIDENIAVWTDYVYKNYHYYSELLMAVRPDFPGPLEAGWRVEDGIRRYYDSNGDRLEGVCLIDGYYYYLDDDGMYTGGWKLAEGNWYYFQSNGHAYANTTVTINGKSYTFNSRAICTNRVVPVNMYRLYNPNSGEHFYTASESERNHLISLGWNDEGTGWIAPETSNTPVYRLYNPYGGEHHYTMSVAERDMLIRAGWNDEGIGWYSDDAQAVPLYRQYNPNQPANNHNYTTSLSENNWLVSIGWRAEGIGWYGIESDS